MTPAPDRDSTAGRVYNDLRNRARRDGRDPAEYFTLYALECFLARLAASRHAQDFVLKGGVLMAAFTARRPTRDVDLAAAGFPNDEVSTKQRLREVVAAERDDGLTFDVESVAGEVIRDQADYAGVRVRVTARLASARIALHIDVNFGDPIWPRPAVVVLPLLLGGELRVRGYPDVMVLAEKIITAIERGELNTRWRDFVDIAAIAGSRRVQSDDLRAAISAVATHRQVALEPLAAATATMPAQAQGRWESWRRKQRLEAATPVSLADLLEACANLADPVIAGLDDGVWDPENRTWEPVRDGG